MSRLSWLPLALLVAACGGQEKVAQQDIDRAQQALEPFKRELMKTLTDGLANGPEKAIAVCKLEAPAIAARSSGPDLQLGRTSHRLRNPVNTPQPWMQPLLDAYVETPAKRDPQAVFINDTWVGYVEPIHVKPMCLVCHGVVKGSLAAKLTSLYPADQATGFAEGDFRGMFWVKLRRSTDG